MHLPRLKSLGCVVILAALSALEGEAAAQPVLAGEEAAKLADAYFLRGKALLKEGNVKEAYKQYKASWDLKKSYDIAANLGNVEYQLGMPRDAAEHLSFSVRNAAVSVTPDRLDRIKKLLDQARALVGGVVVKVNVDGADILVDGEAVGRSPLTDELYVDPGPRVLEARLPGYETVKQTVDCVRASTLEITLALKPVEIQPDAPTGPPADSGTTKPPTGKGPQRSTLPIRIGIGVAAGGVTLGLISVIVSNLRSADATALHDQIAGVPPNMGACNDAQRRESCDKLKSAYVDAGSFRNLAIVGFATAGIAGLATLTYALIPERSPAPAGRVRASVSVGPGGGGLMIHGRF